MPDSPQATLPAAGLETGFPGLQPRDLQAAGIALLVAFGSLSMLPLWLDLWRLWTTDPLRSIGGTLPLFTILGVLSAWRRLGRPAQGTLWGVALLAVAIPLGRLVSVANLVLLFHGETYSLLHRPPVLFLYGAGATLLFGGPRLLRAALAPLSLLLFVNPVPPAYNTAVDMPLQLLCAGTARGFAHTIGLQPTGTELKMMFAPDFGMMIVPGCNGVRGSITFAYLTLIFGYTRRLRPARLAAATLAAFLLGYVLNLLRLCMLVVYYRIGVSVPSIRDFGAQADYAIGITLFLCATVLLGLLIRRAGPPAVEDRETPAMSQPRPAFRYDAPARLLCFVAVVLVFLVPEVQSLGATPTSRPDEQAVLRSFPAVVGPYRLQRTYSERDTNGMITLGLGDYATTRTPGAPIRRLTFGLWVASADHLVARSRWVQGAQAQWTGAFYATAPPAAPVYFVSTFYDDGFSREEDAETACSEASCSNHLASWDQGRLRFLGPRFLDLAIASSEKRLPILVMRWWPDSDTTVAPALRAGFQADASEFTSQIDLPALVRRLGSQP